MIETVVKSGQALVAEHCRAAHAECRARDACSFPRRPAKTRGSQVRDGVACLRSEVLAVDLLVRVGPSCRRLFDASYESIPLGVCYLCPCRPLWYIIFVPLSLSYQTSEEVVVRRLFDVLLII